MRLASWILLALVGVLLSLGSVVSMRLAYVGPASADVLASTNLAELTADKPDVETALRGRRGTAASFSLAYGVLFLMVVAGPYRRGETWAWWALLVSAGALAVATALRVPALDTTLGVSTALALLTGVLIGLLLDVKRLMKPAS